MITGRYNYGRIRLTTVGRSRRLRVRLTQCGHSCSDCGFGAAASLTQSGQKNAMSASRPVDDCGRLQLWLTLRWSPKTEQVGKRESSLGTAVWPEVRLVDYTEEAQC